MLGQQMRHGRRTRHGRSVAPRPRKTRTTARKSSRVRRPMVSQCALAECRERYGTTVAAEHVSFAVLAVAACVTGPRSVLSAKGPRRRGSPSRPKTARALSRGGAAKVCSRYARRNRAARRDDATQEAVTPAGVESADGHRSGPLGVGERVKTASGGAAPRASTSVCRYSAVGSSSQRRSRRAASCRVPPPPARGHPEKKASTR